MNKIIKHILHYLNLKDKYLYTSISPIYKNYRIYYFNTIMKIKYGTYDYSDRDINVELYMSDETEYSIWSDLMVYNRIDTIKYIIDNNLHREFIFASYHYGWNVDCCIYVTNLIGDINDSKYIINNGNIDLYKKYHTSILKKVDIQTEFNILIRRDNLCDNLEHFLSVYNEDDIIMCMRNINTFNNNAQIMYILINYYISLNKHIDDIWMNLYNNLYNNIIEDYNMQERIINYIIKWYGIDELLIRYIKICDYTVVYKYIILHNIHIEDCKLWTKWIVKNHIDVNILNNLPNAHSIIKNIIKMLIKGGINIKAEYIMYRSTLNQIDKALIRKIINLAK